MLDGISGLGAILSVSADGALSNVGDGVVGTSITLDGESATLYEMSEVKYE